VTRILIVGAGGHAQVIAEAVLSHAQAGDDWQLAGFLDDNESLQGRAILGATVVGKIQQVSRLDHDAVVVGIGHNATRARVFHELRQSGERVISVIHSRAVVANDVVLGEGCVVFANAVINTGSIIGPDVIVNTGATIDHHARIGAHVHIAPGAHLGGTVTVEEGAILGIGSSVIPNRTIGAWSVVGAGAAVIHDVPSHVTVVGVPAQLLQK
jgi:sugar O-acyltransferase (sialic acid O-acetyltransferase NeuD family)